jgi:DegV family protein with EDD domain
MIHLITDTTACLPEDIQSKYQITVIPQMIHFGETSFTEGVDLNNPSFLKLLANSKELPKTAAPPPELFAAVFQTLKDTGDAILCIHPSTDLSGTVRSAETASLDFPNSDIRVLDTRLIASPLGVVVHQAALWRAAGLHADEIENQIISLSNRGRIYFLVSTLEYLARGGRIGGASALLGNVLQVKPILSLVHGQVEPHLKERTFSRALDRIKTIVIDEFPTQREGHLTIMHADQAQQASDLAVFFENKLNIYPPLVSNLPPAIITHAGPGSIAVGFFA